MKLLSILEIPWMELIVSNNNLDLVSRARQNSIAEPKDFQQTQQK